MSADLPSPTPRMRLKRLLRRLVCRATAYSGVSTVWYHALAKRGVRILAYHGVETPPRSALSVSVESFREQMRFLKENHAVISIDRFAEQTAGGGPFPAGSVLLTFDDGYGDFYANAFPVLQELQLPATCFVIASQIDGGNRRFMGADELKAMLDSGLITVGSHSFYHRSVSRLGDAEAITEIAESKAYLERALGTEIRHFCYPFGTYNDVGGGSGRILREAGYVTACTSINGINVEGTRPLRLRRTKVEWGDDIKTFKRMMRGGLDIWVLVDFFLRFLQGPRDRPVAESAAGSHATTS